MEIKINVPDDRLMEFAVAFETYLSSSPKDRAEGDAKEEPGKKGTKGLMCAKDIAKLLGLASSNSLYASKRYALPPDDLVVKRVGKAKYWTQGVVMSHLAGLGLVGRRNAGRQI